MTLGCFHILLTTLDMYSVPVGIYKWPMIKSYSLTFTRFYKCKNSKLDID